jgi:cbb3-type cytochrome oxidase cytochrome c subunit
MRKGEKWIYGTIILVVVVFMGRNALRLSDPANKDPGIPFYSTASHDLEQSGSELYHRLNCKHCHSLWTVRDMMEFVPAPALDGIGSIRDEQWFYNYLSATNPQATLPSRLKKEYQMPSYADISDEERHTLAAYLASLKVKDWYLEDTRKAEYEKLTGKNYQDTKTNVEQQN